MFVHPILTQYCKSTIVKFKKETNYTFVHQRCMLNTENTLEVSHYVDHPYLE